MEFKGVPAESGCSRPCPVELGRSTGVEIPWLLWVSLPGSSMLLGKKGLLWSLASVFGAVPLHLFPFCSPTPRKFKISSFPFLSPHWTKAFLSTSFQICCAPAPSSSLWHLLNFIHGVNGCPALGSSNWTQVPRCSQAQWSWCKGKDP